MPERVYWLLRAGSPAVGVYAPRCIPMQLLTNTPVMTATACTAVCTACTAEDHKRYASEMEAYRERHGEAVQTKRGRGKGAAAAADEAGNKEGGADGEVAAEGEGQGEVGESGAKDGAKQAVKGRKGKAAKGGAKKAGKKQQQEEEAEEEEEEEGGWMRVCAIVCVQA